MPPNLIVKAAFVRGELNDLQKKDFFGKDVIRTDFILQNMFAYLVKDQYKFDAISAINKREKDVLEGMKETVDAFRLNYASTVKSLCAEIDLITEDTLGSVLLGVSNELFSEGITWSRIIAFFVFVGELTILCVSRKISKSIVDVMYECFSRLVNEKLQSWIDDHDGWEGITSLSVVAQQENSLKISNPGWAKSLLYGTVRMIGTLAHIANTSNPVLP